jgi:hypothetical protein
MHNSRFVVLMGHLNEYSLSDLIGILRHQRKTGRLLIEYPNTPASFYFEEGELVDVQLDRLAGLQAICVAKAQPASPFNFNPLIRASQRSIDNSLQRVVSELFGCWDESPLQIDVVSSSPALPTVDLPVTPEVPVEPTVLSGAEVLALPAFVPSNRQNRTHRAMAAAGLMMLGISSVIAVTGGFQRKEKSFGIAAAPTETQMRPVLTSSTESSSASGIARSVISHNDSQKSKDSASITQQDRRRDSKTAANSENTAKVGASTVAPEPVQAVPTENKNPARDTPSNVQWVDVVMHVENGRVLQAAIAKHKSDVDGYEALALRIARQRRYATNVTGQETVRIRVTRPE